MKKVLFIALLAIVGLGNLNAQTSSFGVVAGFHNFSQSAKGGDVTLSSDAQGFYFGVSGEFNLSDALNLQTELQYATASVDGDSESWLILPVMAKYYISDDFSIQAGPQFDLLLGDNEGINTLGLGLGIGASYDFSEKFYVNTRYVFGLTNRIDEDYLFGQDVTLKFNTFQIGLGYRF